MVSFIASILISALMVAGGVAYGRRRTPGIPVSWGEAMLAANYVFAGFVLFYGLVPHYWLTWAESELGWRPDRVWFGENGHFVVPVVQWVGEWHWVPVQISAESVRDIIAVVIYGVALVVNMILWSWWQKRGTKAEVEQVSSQYGRPLVREA